MSSLSSNLALHSVHQASCHRSAAIWPCTQFIKHHVIAQLPSGPALSSSSIMSSLGSHLALHSVHQSSCYLPAAIWPCTEFIEASRHCPAYQLIKPADVIMVHLTVTVHGLIKLSNIKHSPTNFLLRKLFLARRIVFEIIIMIKSDIAIYILSK